MSQQDPTHVARVLSALMPLGIEQGLIARGDPRKIHQGMGDTGLWAGA